MTIQGIDAGSAPILISDNGCMSRKATTTTAIQVASVDVVVARGEQAAPQARGGKKNGVKWTASYRVSNA